MAPMPTLRVSPELAPIWKAPGVAVAFVVAEPAAMPRSLA
jgi:hypothetical protein